jgi:hypothetical protein
MAMGNISEKQLIFVFFSSFILLQVFFLLFGESAYGYGGADNIAHYQIAKYSFKYPELFLDLWGKPVYTTFLAPFALIGYKAAKAFNLFVAVITLLLTSKIAKKLYPGSSLITIVLIAFAPVYFLLAISCLTEVLFSLVLVAAVYFFIHNRFALSAVILSFIPFVRSEGFVLLPIFALAFVLQRSYRSILFLAVGAVFYSIIGYFVFGDILWIINKQPYSLGESIYGSGSLFHFIKNSNSIFGIPLTILIVAGLFYWGYDVIRNFSLRSQNTILFIIIAGSWMTFFAAHSYVWWKGTGGSLGLIRVMGGIIPLAALTGMKIFGFVSEKLKSKNITYTIFSVFALFQIVLMFTQNNLMLKADPTEQLIKKSADYIRYNEEGKKVFYFNPLLIHFLEIDPYDITKCNWWVADKQQPSNTLEWGDLLVWDAHFGPNEGGVQFENLEKDPFLKKIKSFYPIEKVTVLGGYDYSVHIFKKSPNKNDSLIVSDNYEQVLSFESYLDERVKEVDGLKVWELDSSQEYSPNIVLSADVVKRYEILEATVTLSYKALQALGANETMLVFSAENEGKSIRYEKADLVSSVMGFQELKLNVRMAANIPDKSRMLIYVWNHGKKNILIEKIKVEIKSY